MPMLLATVLAVLAVTTGPAADVTNTSATLTATVDPGATGVHFEYGTTPGTYGLTAAAGEIGEDGAAAAPVSGLTAATTYYYRVVADGADAPEYGEERSFKTAPNPRPPKVTRTRAVDVGPTSARLTAVIDPRDSATSFVFEWGPTAKYGNTTPVLPGDGAVSVPLTGLEPRTRYHFRLVATNAAGTKRSNKRRFLTDRLPTAISLDLADGAVTWGEEVVLGGRVSGVGVADTPLVLEVQRFPFDTGFVPLDATRAGNDGGYLFRVANLWEAARYRVVSRTQAVAVSPIAQADSRLRVGARTRRRGARKMKIEGSVLPAAAGTASLERRNRRGHWRAIKSKATWLETELRGRYRFTVRRKRRERDYRVVVAPDDGGAHVRGTSRTVAVKARRR